MNTLEESMLTEIQKYAYYPVNEESAAKSFTTIAIDFAKGFAIYMDDNGYSQNTDGDWEGILSVKQYTSGQLIELYIQSL